MTSVVRLDDGVNVALGAVLARAGEGTVYEIADRSEWVAKVFHPDLKDLDAKLAKVAAMVASPPDGAVQSDGFVVLTWPLHVVNGADGVAGYVMPRIDTTNAVEIHSVSNPSNRMSPLATAPQWTTHVTWRHLVNVAANLCLAVDAVHRVDAVIGDFQERNILVGDTTHVTLVDCDSMQFTDAAGHQFLCGVGRPEFTAPELAGANLATTAREKPSDLFALAVHIHLLLMAGNHPFLRGDWTGGGEQPDAMTLAKSGQWAGGPGSALRTHPLAPPVAFLPRGIQRLFSRAFTEGARDPAARPSAAEWLSALRAIRIGSCPRGHQIPINTQACPWCVIDDERAQRRIQRSQTAKTPQATYQAAGPRGAFEPPVTSGPTSGSSNRGRNIALAALAGIGILVAIALSDNHDANSRRNSYVPSTTTYSATTSPYSYSPTYTSTYSPTYTYTTTYPSTVSSSYPAPNEQSYASVYQNATVGECVNKVLGNAQGDGTLSIVSLYLTDCGASDATDRVTMRTNDEANCPSGGSWVRSGSRSPYTVLCMQSL